jgi:hypothetical protein
MRTRAGFCAVAALFTSMIGCELTEITLSSAEDVIVAEVILRADRTQQRAYLHRTATANGNARVFGAVIRVQDDSTGQALLYEVTADSLCVRTDRPQEPASIGTCYTTGSTVVWPGRSYSLRIEVDGRVLTARTQVPGAFAMLQPTVLGCALTPGQTLDLTWTTSTGAWVYLVEAQMTGLREALRRAGADVDGSGPVELTGLSISGADTTFAFPGQLGLFDRADTELHPILLAIRDGLPPDVTSSVTIGAADRNYVNWVRGGTFNPSGQVRIPSIRGAGGTGVFGSLVTGRAVFSTRPPVNEPPCQ